MREAREYRQEIEIINADPKDGGMSNPISFFGDNLFSYGAVRFPGECDCIEICKADDMMTECEIAASAIIKLVRDHGYRWRDFAVAVRDWDAWQDSAENVFAAYNVPLQMTVKTDIIEKPVIAAVFGALDVILGDWDYKSVFKYLKTGMTGIAPYDIDLL